MSTVMVTVRGTYLDGRVRDELEGADDEDEHAHDVFVALEGFGQGQADFWLDLVGRDEGEALEFEEDEGEGDEGEDEEEEQYVVAVEEVIGLGGGVVEPEGLREGEVAAQRRHGLRDGSVGEHRHRKPRIAGGGGLFFCL